MSRSVLQLNVHYVKPPVGATRGGKPALGRPIFKWSAIKAWLDGGP
jgi:hypothetical protein